MKPFTYNNHTLSPISNQNHNYLLSLVDTAKALDIYPQLITLTLQTESSFFEENFHYLKVDDEVYFSRVGIIRLALLIGSVEALQFSLLCEKELIAFENFYEKLKIASS